MLEEEFLAQFGFLRVVGIEADHVNGLVALFGDQTIDVGLVGGDDRGLIVTGFDISGGFPQLEAYAGVVEELGDGGAVVGVVQRLVGGVSGENFEVAHGDGSVF